MSSSDIYEFKEGPSAKKQDNPSVSRRHRDRTQESFDEAVHKDVPATHRRRRHNSGFRRFQHLMKKPEFSKKFWIIALSVGGAILALLVIWDLFFRYPNEKSGASLESYSFEMK